MQEQSLTTDMFATGAEWVETNLLGQDKRR